MQLKKVKLQSLYCLLRILLYDCANESSADVQLCANYHQALSSPLKVTQLLSSFSKINLRIDFQLLIDFSASFVLNLWGRIKHLLHIVIHSSFVMVSFIEIYAKSFCYNYINTQMTFEAIAVTKAMKMKMRRMRIDKWVNEGAKISL
jgi:hypothetical protein